MPQLARNAQAIKGAKCPPDKRQGQYTIEGVPNLYLIVSKTGTKSWQVRYKRRIEGKERLRSKPLGRFPAVGLKEATQARDALMAEVHKGADPVAQLKENRQQEIAPTLGELAERWMSKHVEKNLRQTTANFYHTCLQAFILPELGLTPADKVTRRDIIDLTEKIADESTPRMANSVGSTITTIYRWAEDHELVGVNPAYRIPKHVGNNVTRERILTDAEFPVFWRALNGTNFALIFRLLLASGQRVGEVVGAQVPEFDFENSDGPIWIIPKGRSKNKLPHVVPITPLALGLWHDALDCHANETHIFPAQRPSSNTPHIRRDSVTNAMTRIRTQHNFNDLVTHDLRRTVYTKLGKLRIASDIKSRCFNHIAAARSSKVAKNYDQWEYLDEKRAALTAWEDELMQLIKS